MSEIKIATTVEQSKRLINAGLNPMKADMTHSHRGDESYELLTTPFHYGCFDEADMPAWSLSALISILPVSIHSQSILDEESVLGYLLILPSVTGRAWSVRYACGQEEEGKTILARRGLSLIDACVLMVTTLLQKGYNLKNQ